MTELSFTSAVQELAKHQIISIPLLISQALPSRGMVMAIVTIENQSYTYPLEPDGRGSHWIDVSDIAHEARDSEMVIALEPINTWPEPIMPQDIMKAFESAAVLDQWHAITTKARWAWLRWIRSTKNPSTRSKRIETACQMLASGKKRPCCFDNAKCTVPELSKSGILISKE